MTRPRRLSVVGEACERAGEGRLTSRQIAPQPRAVTIMTLTQELWRSLSELWRRPFARRRCIVAEFWRRVMALGPSSGAVLAPL